MHFTPPITLPFYKVPITLLAKAIKPLAILLYINNPSLKAASYITPLASLLLLL